MLLLLLGVLAGKVACSSWGRLQRTKLLLRLLLCCITRRAAVD
jgi:hypothetical protein